MCLAFNKKRAFAQYRLFVQFFTQVFQFFIEMIIFFLMTFRENLPNLI